MTPDPQHPLDERRVEVTVHYHDCPWGSGGKHQCSDPKCQPKDYDEPPIEGGAFHG